ncbi:MAG: response regulator [Chloroflexi bacterium]|nr:response regulator [Chloroflexota bacterium]
MIREPNLTLLVVDDEPMMHETLVDVLEDDYRTILHARDGEECLEVAARRRPDLILLDMTMPRLDGIPTCRALRQNPDLVDTPIVMLTARASEDQARAAFEAGADDYVVKPFSIGQLRARLRTAALGRQASPAVEA